MSKEGFGDATLPAKTEDYTVDLTQIVPIVTASEQDGSVKVTMPSDSNATQVKVTWTDEQGVNQEVIFEKNDLGGWDSKNPTLLPSIANNKVTSVGTQDSSKDLSVIIPQNDIKDGTKVVAEVTGTSGGAGGKDDAIAGRDTAPKFAEVEIQDGNDGALAASDLVNGLVNTRVYFSPDEFMPNSHATAGTFDVKVNASTMTASRDYTVGMTLDSATGKYTVTAKSKDGTPDGTSVKVQQADDGRYYFEVNGLKAPLTGDITVDASFTTANNAIVAHASDTSTRLASAAITSIQVFDNVDELADYQEQIMAKAGLSGSYNFPRLFSGEMKADSYTDDNQWNDIRVRVEEGNDGSSFVGKTLQVQIVNVTTGNAVETFTQEIAAGTTEYRFASATVLDDGKYNIVAKVLDVENLAGTQKSLENINIDTVFALENISLNGNNIVFDPQGTDVAYGIYHLPISNAFQALQVANTLSYITDGTPSDPISMPYGSYRYVLVDKAGNVLTPQNYIGAYRITGDINTSKAPSASDLLNKTGRFAQNLSPNANGMLTTDGDDYINVMQRGSGYNSNEDAWNIFKWDYDGLTGVINGVTPSDATSRGYIEDRQVEIDTAGGNDTIDAMMVMANTAIYTDSKSELEGPNSGNDLIHLRRGVWGYGKPSAFMNSTAMGMAGDGDQVFATGGGNDKFIISGTILTKGELDSPWAGGGVDSFYWAANTPRSYLRSSDDVYSFFMTTARVDMGSGDDEVLLKGGILADADDTINHSNYFNLGAGNDNFIVGGSIRDTFSKQTSSNVIDLGTGEDHLRVDKSIENSTLIISRDSSTIKVAGDVKDSSAMLLGEKDDIVQIGGSVSSSGNMNRFYNVISNNTPTGEVYKEAWYKPSQDVLSSKQLRQDMAVEINLSDGNNQMSVGGSWSNTALYAGRGHDTLSIARDLSNVNSKDMYRAIDLGDGDNTIEIGGNVSSSTIITRSGDDHVTMNSLFSHWQADIPGSKVNLGSGDDTLVIKGENVNTINYNSQGQIAVYNASIDTGADDDTVEIYGNVGYVNDMAPNSVNLTTIALGSGNDTLIVDGEGTLGAWRDSNLRLGAGDDAVYIRRLDLQTDSYFVFDGSGSSQGGHDVIVIDQLLTPQDASIGTPQGSIYNLKLRMEHTDKNSPTGTVETTLKDTSKWTKSSVSKSLQDWFDSSTPDNAQALLSHADGAKYHQYTYSNATTGNSYTVYIADNDTNNGIL